ncbi:DsbA family protein [Weissella paramesenteroides]|nr:DsbA family protein [Weissella paramesenteroides]QPI46039.1 DsbA family protein [Weissella paramesenteroides]
MLEVYHFVTPLSAESIASEEMIMSYFEEMNQFVSYKLIPIVTMQSVRDTYHELKRNYKNIDYATVANNLSQLVLDTKAVQSQGRKRRAFYFKMQTQLLANKTYSKNLVLSTIAELNLDENIF